MVSSLPIACRLRKQIASVLLGFFLSIALVSEGEARFSISSSLSLGEEYNDNIFFSKPKEHDFITTITPALTFRYTLPTDVSANSPVFTLNIAPSGQIFARHSELNNFGNSYSLSGSYAYSYSPRLIFSLSDTLNKVGATRTSGIGGQSPFQPVRTPTTFLQPGQTEPLPASQRLGDFISSGSTLGNFFSFQGSYLYAPNITFMGGYSNAYTGFFHLGGSEISHSIGFRGVYNWRQAHNLHAGYTVSIIKSRNGGNAVVHNFDLGDDYSSGYTYTLKLTPTLTLSASSGFALSTGISGPRVANSSNLILQQVWQRGTLAAGVQKGLTGSYGISGVSDTTSLFSTFVFRLTRYLTGTAGVNYSLFDTSDVNFSTFEAQAGLQYPITSWLSSNLKYSHRWINSGAGARNTDLLTRGKVSGNSVFLVFTTYFDIWPNVGLARRVISPLGLTSPFLTPVLTPPPPYSAPPRSLPSP